MCQRFGGEKTVAIEVERVLNDGIAGSYKTSLVIILKLGFVIKSIH